jgi:alanine-synthesizing transaminase
VFSRRTAWNIIANPIADALAARRRAGLPVLDLTETNPTRVGLPYPEREIRAALADARLLRYEPTPFGHATARRAVAEYHQVSPEQVVLTASTSEAYGYLFKLLADAGDRVLVPAPSYPLFDYLAGLEQIEPVPYPCRLEGGEWFIDFDALEAAWDAGTRAVLTVSPNNPTGALLHEDEAARLLALCAARHAALIADEVFADPAAPTAPTRVRSLAGREDALVFVLSGLSKTCLLPQLKAAWILASGPAGLCREALARLEIVADTYLSVNTPVQVALPELLGLRERIRRPLRDRLATNRGALERALKGTAATLLPCDGGWSAVLRVPREPDEQTRVLRLIEDGVVVHPGFFFDFPTDGFLVVSLLAAPEALARGAALLAADADR